MLLLHASATGFGSFVMGLQDHLLLVRLLRVPASHRVVVAGPLVLVFRVHLLLLHDLITSFGSTLVSDMLGLVSGCI